ncbi:MAG: hypothetical protein Kow00120_16040 [Anaerolineae bacterium]
MGTTGAILCATRGGEASYHAQDHAIALAKERGARLVFFFVADAKFTTLVSAAIVVDVETEIEHMGEFLVLMAKERAEKQGVEAETLVKRGVFSEALIEAIQETGCDTVIFGQPKAHRRTTLEYLETLSETLASEYGVETIIA